MRLAGNRKIAHSEPKDDRVVFRAGPILKELDRRTGEGSRDLIAKRDLVRYYVLLKRISSTIELSRPEVDLICDALRNRTFDEQTFDLIWAGIQEETRLRKLDRKYHVDGDKLVERLQDMRPGQKIALLDAIEICLKRGGDAEAIAESGLVRG